MWQGDVARLSSFAVQKNNNTHQAFGNPRYTVWLCRDTTHTPQIIPGETKRNFPTQGHTSYHVVMCLVVREQRECLSMLPSVLRSFQSFSVS